MTGCGLTPGSRARQLKSAQNMVHANLSGWLVRLQDRVRELITASSLSEHQKTLLYRVNSRKAWWVPALDLAVGHRAGGVWFLSSTAAWLRHLGWCGLR